MKKLVLYSDQGIERRELDKEVLALIGKENPKIGYIPSCSDIERKYFNIASEYYEGMGIKDPLYFDLDKEYDESKLEELMKCDAIHLSGGNTFYFLNSLKKRNMIDRIKEYVEKGGVLIGLSAGSIIMSETIEAAQFGDYNEIDLKDLNALGLVDFEFMPHWNTDDRYLNDLLEYSKEVKKVIYTCKDGDGIVINNHEIKFIGEIGKIENGKYIELK